MSRAVKPPWSLQLLLAVSPCVAGCLDAATLGPGVFCDAVTPCTSDPLYPVCDRARHRCVTVDAGVVDCAAARDCPASAPLCDPTARQCTACAPAGPSDGCRARDASRPLCQADRGVCVACLQSTDCTQPTAAFCSGGLCRGCRSHAECPSRVCGDDGACVDPATVVYVDNRGRAGCLGGSGKQGDPFCEIADALLAVQKDRPLVRVMGSKVPYHRIQSGPSWPMSATLLGDGRDAQPASTITDPTGACVYLTSNHSLTLDGMDLAGCTQGVLSDGGGAVALLRSRVRGMLSGPGVSLRSSVDLLQRLDAVIISGNPGGLDLQARHYDVRNCSLVGNRGPFGGARISPDSAGVFAFNTVRGNSATAPGVAGGVDCGAWAAGGPQVLLASIVVGNLPAPLGAHCGGLDGVVVGASATDGAGLLKVEPRWASNDPLEYRLSPLLADNPRLVDAVGPERAGGMLHDIEGTHRPQGAAWDIGAHEVLQPTP